MRSRSGSAATAVVPFDRTSRVPPLMAGGGVSAVVTPSKIGALADLKPGTEPPEPVAKLHVEDLSPPVPAGKKPPVPPGKSPPLPVEKPPLPLENPPLPPVPCASPVLTHPPNDPVSKASPTQFQNVN